MRIVTNMTGPMLRVASHQAPTLSHEAKRRLKWMAYYEALSKPNVSATCRHFDISRQAFYRWWNRYDPRDLTTLEDRSSRPRRTRMRTWTTAEIVAIRQQREQYVRWGKLKLQVLLRGLGLDLALSRIGRILGYLKRSGQLKEPRLNRTAPQRRRWLRPHATRKPAGYIPLRPGDLVQIDTVDLRLGRDVVKQFSAVDVVSRFATATVAGNATASLAVRALDALVRMPFPVRAIQVDGGSEFMADFEAACRDRGLLLFVNPPYSPKLNGRVERLNRTSREECYDLTLEPFTVAGLTRAARRWERTYNTIRPHQALAMLTPTQYLATHHPKEVSPTC
jgi:transposase InsO family protein